MIVKMVLLLSNDILRKIIRSIRSRGFKQLFHILHYYSYEFYWRLYFNIPNLKLIHLKEIGINNEECHYYSHSDFLDFRRVMNTFTVNPNKDVFIDFGSGMGTTVLMAAMYPFKKVIGIEIAEEFNAAAKNFLKKNRRKLKCKDIDLLLIDATRYVVPEDANFVYFYNPFHGEVLEKVIDNIKKSLKKNPRDLYMIFKNTEHFEKIKSTSEWLVEVKRQKCFWDHDCVVYKSKE